MNHCFVVVKTPEFTEIFYLEVGRSESLSELYRCKYKYLMSDCTQRMTILYRFYVSEMFQVLQDCL